MKLVAITTFPPSRKPLSSFGYHAILRFLESPEIGQVVVLADRTDDAELSIIDGRLTIERCWHYNHPLSQIRLISAVTKHKPDVIWMNFQYTLFGPNLVAVFLGVLLPAFLKKLGYSVVLLLHNYLGGTDLEQIGIAIPNVVKIGMKRSESIAMRSIIRSDRIFTMLRAYQAQLSNEHPSADIHFVEHDLYAIQPFHPICTTQRHVVTLGYFGTYKRLDILLDGFQLVRRSLPDTELLIAGQESCHTPGYLERLVSHYPGQLHNVRFLGYVKHEDIPSFFWNSNVVCVTNATTPGSSALPRLAAVYGRGLVVPHVDSFLDLQHDGWGVTYYEHNNAGSLAATLLAILRNPTKQIEMATANHRKAVQSNNQFQKAHLQAFRELSASTSQ